MIIRERLIVCLNGVLSARLLLLLALLGAVCVFFGAGCTTSQEYKEQADEEVYDIIDCKWKSEHGQKVNYRVSDVEPDANDINLCDIYDGDSGVVTLAEAVGVATAQNRDYQRQKELLYLTTLDLTLVRHDFATRWFGTFDANYNKDADDESVDYSAALGFNKLLKDGTKISSSIALDWLRYLTGDPRTSLGSVLSSTITKPIMQGSGEKVVTENLTQAERNVLYQIRSFNRFRKKFVVTVVSDYFRVLQDLDSVVNAENNYKNLTFAFERAEMLAESGRLPQLEADQTKQNMLRAKDTLTQAVRRYEQSLDNFKLVLAMPMDCEFVLDPNELEALVAMGVDELDYTPEESVDTALANRLDLMNDADRMVDAGRKIDVTEDSLRARLDLVASVNVESPDGQRPGRLEFQNGDYSYGFELDLPFDKLAERNAYRESLIDLIRAGRDYEQAVDEVKLEVRGSYRKLRESAQRYVIQQNSLKLAEERVKSTNMLVEAGRAQSRDLLDAQDDLLSAQNSRTTALIDYTIAKLAFFRDLGVLQVRPDGMWKMYKRN